MVQLHSLNKQIQHNMATGNREFISHNSQDGGAVAQMAGAMLFQIFSNMANNMGSTSSSSSSSSTSSKSSGSESTNETDAVGQSEEPDKTVDEVKELLKGKVSEKSKHWDELTSKYNLHRKNGMDENNIVSRLCTYNRALISHDYQMKYGEYYEMRLPILMEQYPNFFESDPEEQERILDEFATQCDSELKQAGIVDKDKIIEANLPKNQGGEVTAGYVDAVYKRGVGYVEMYDKDGDGGVSIDEFREFEEKDLGRTLTADEIAETERVFNLMNANKEKGGTDAQRVDNHEMAAYMFAVSRLHDNRKAGENTADDITFQEWRDASSGKYDYRVVGWRDAFIESTPSLSEK